jgi:hypothetical protein
MMTLEVDGGLETQFGYRRKFATTVTTVILAIIATVTNAIAAIVIVPTFAITITAATVKVTAFVVIISVTAVVAHAQHIVHAKPPNGQNNFPLHLKVNLPLEFQ